MSKEVPQALKVQGCQSKYKLINGTYEKLPADHHDRPSFILRDATPCYIFHTGKARWVISKRIDDGQRCYAFKKDEPPSADPTGCTGDWITCSDDGKTWTPDTSISLAQVPGSDDAFVQMRISLEEEMKGFGLIDTSSLKTLWKRLDFNGNNVVSLAEVDKMVVEMCSGGAWPEWLNNKPALMRAFQKSKSGVDGGRDDFVEKCEFHDLLLNIFWFNKLWKVFDDIDIDDDRRVDLAEFKKGLDKLNLKFKDDAEAAEQFGKIDTNSGGEVLFVEFCSYIRQRVNPDDNPSFDSDIVSGEKAGTTLRKKHGNSVTQSHFVQKKNMSMFDSVEAEFKAVIADPKQDKLVKMWQHLDFNGNGVVSLAEIDKFVIESYSILNHKPALMRAYKKTCEQGDGDDWVQKKEFKSLLGNLVYFNKLFWLFDESEEDPLKKDRKMALQEFKLCLVTAGMKMGEAKAADEFNKIDTNKGGSILFDEFCGWFASKSCPAAMQSFISPGDPA